MNAVAMVTGGAGFIGSHVVERLLKSSRVVCVDNFDPFYDRALKERNIARARKNPDFVLEEIDICDAKALRAVFARHRPGVIIHLAGRAGVRPSLRKPEEYHRTNTEATWNMLECARDFQAKRFVFGSSSSVYGVTSRLPFSERDALLRPISPYAVSKRTAEALCHGFHRQTGIPTVCLRFFTVYGPRQRPEMAIAKFTRKILSGEPIEVYGDGKSRRDYTYVEDIVEGILAATRADLGFELINLGDAKSVSLSMLLSLLEKATKKKPVLRRKENQPGDVPVTFASLAKARRVLGYKPRVPIREGLTRYVAWVRQKAGQA